jgi:hypothetical protein
VEPASAQLEVAQPEAASEPDQPQAEAPTEQPGPENSGESVIEDASSPAVAVGAHDDPDGPGRDVAAEGADA